MSASGTRRDTGTCLSSTNWSDVSLLDRSKQYSVSDTNDGAKTTEYHCLLRIMYSISVTTNESVTVVRSKEYGVLIPVRNTECGVIPVRNTEYYVSSIGGAIQHLGVPPFNLL